MKRIVTVVVAAAALIGAQAAFAGDSTVLSGYGSSSAKPTIKVASAVAKTSTSTPAPAVAKADTLPFTGADLGVVAIAGVALVGLGFGLRRVGRDQNRS